jgi:hypothetical protein
MAEQQVRLTTEETQRKGKLPSFGVDSSNHLSCHGHFEEGRAFVVMGK